VELDGAVVAVTGGGSGIGAALCRAFAAAGARLVLVADRDLAAARAVATALPVPAVALEVDVTVAAQLDGLVARALSDGGRLDVLCANAGVTGGLGLGGPADWEQAWRVNVMGVVAAATAALPALTSTGGALVITASAAGLLTNPDSAPYTASKHAAVAFAEWLAITGPRQVQVHCLAPGPVGSTMTANLPPRSATLASGALLEADEVAECTLQAVRDGRFLVLPHPEVADQERARAGDRDRWLHRMRRWTDAVHSGVTMHSGDRLASTHLRARTRTSALLHDAVENGVDLADLAVPATPGWTVLDVAAHLVGNAAALARGVRPGADLQAFVDEQVQAHRGTGVPALLEQWEQVGPWLEQELRERPAPYAALVYDAVAHEQDLRGALGAPPLSSIEDARSDVRVALELGHALLAADLRRAGAPAVELRTPEQLYVIGHGAPGVVLEGTAYELFRALGSRRTVAEVAAFVVDGDLTAVLPALLHMPPPTAPLPRDS
jgi:uncharacterized protein (TIGR03083 family)